MEEFETVAAADGNVVLAAADVEPSLSIIDEFAQDRHAGTA
ncbi:hypothetical protein [Antarcticimicrobium luteum]|nr:hypothetical protein [Antarcticimicrobium luteum]